MAQVGDRANKSPIWVYFDIMEYDEKFVMCKLCFGKFSRGGVGKAASTTPMLNHIKKVHPYEYGIIQMKRAANMHAGSITTGCGPPILNLPHNHVPDMHAVAIARCRSIVPTEPTVRPDCPVEVIPLPVTTNIEASETCDRRENDNDMEEEVLEPAQPKSILKPQNKNPIKITVPAQKPPPPSSPDSEMCLRWNSHHTNMQTVFPVLMDNEQYVDVTLAAEGKLIKCHKLILSSCSTYFDEMLKHTTSTQQTIIFLRNIEFWQIRALVDFMYKGEVNVDQTKLESLLRAAEDLQIKGLTGKTPKKESGHSSQLQHTSVPVVPETVMRETPDRDVKSESPVFEDDDGDEEYFPNPEYRRKYQGKQKRKRKISVPPDPSLLKHVKINLKGTKSRPIIKQPKFYSPDYPEYDPDRCVSPPKVDSDPVFHIDNIKLEPIDIEVPHSPSIYDMDTLIDKPFGESLQIVDKNRADDNPSTPKEPKVYGRQHKTPSKSPEKLEDSKTPAKINIEEPSTSKNTLSFETIKVEPSTSKIDVDISREHRKIVLEAVPGKDSSLGKKAIIVKCPNIKKIIDDHSSMKKFFDETSGVKKLIDATSRVVSDTEKGKPPQIRVRNLPMAETVLKKFATSQLTSILKKGDGTGGGQSQIILKKFGSKSTILKPFLSGVREIKVPSSGAERLEVGQKISLLAKTLEIVPNKPPDKEEPQEKSKDEAEEVKNDVGESEVKQTSGEEEEIIPD